MKILIIADSIQIGGFSKSLINLMNCLCKINVEIDLFLFKSSNDLMENTIPKMVNIVQNDWLYKFRKTESKYLRKILHSLLNGNLYYMLKYMYIKNIKYRNTAVPQDLVVKYYAVFSRNRLKCIYTKFDFYDSYDCVVSWEEIFCNYFLASKVLAKKKIGYIHPDYISAKFDKNIDLPFLSKLSNIAVISEAANNSICIVMPEIANKVITIPNVINISKVRDYSDNEVTDITDGVFTILTVCRLQNTSKALERAVAISLRLKADELIFKWYIVGDGEDRRKLELQINESGLDDVFILLGSRENPYPYMRKANIFVMQSYYEGRPLAVDESMIIGTPVLVTNYSSAKEQVDDGVNGFIVNNDYDSIYNKIRDIIINPNQLETMRTNLQSKKWDDFEDCSTFVNAILNNI